MKHSLAHHRSHIMTAVRIYRPLLIVLLFIVLYVALRSSVRPSTSAENIVNDVMAGFFLATGVLQLIFRRSSKKALLSYDPLAQRFPVYATLYAPLLLVFGVFLHTNSLMLPVNVLTVVLFSFQTYGMIRLLRRGDTATCACVGGAFAIPLSWVSVGENVAMIALSLISLIFLVY